MSNINILKETIDETYKVFSVYEKPKKMVGCPCCISESELEELLSYSLKEIPPKSFISFCFSILLTWGSEDEFKYFLPRLLEIAVFNSLDLSVDLAFVFDKLHHANWLKWDCNEIDIIKKYFNELWKFKLNNYIDYDENLLSIHELLTALATTDVDLDPFLEYWKNLKCNDSYLNMVDFIYDNINYLFQVDCEYNFYNEKQKKLIISWIKENDICNLALKAIPFLDEKHNWRVEEYKKFLKKFTKNPFPFF